MEIAKINLPAGRQANEIKLAFSFTCHSVFIYGKAFLCYNKHMEKPKESIEKLASNIGLFIDDISKTLAARQEILSRMTAKTHTQEDVRTYIILSKRMISTLERKKQTIKKIKEYYEENDPENIQGKYWLYELEATILDIELNKSLLDDFLNGRPSEKTDQLIQQSSIARDRVQDVIDQIRSSENHNQESGHMSELAKAFFEAPGPSYETLILGKFMRYDGTELILPNCGINSFYELQEYGEKFNRDVLPLIQTATQDVIRIKLRIMASKYSNDPKVLAALRKVETTNESAIKKAEELRVHFKKIQQEIILPVTIDEQLEKDLLALDRLHAELVKIMLDVNEVQSKLTAVLTT